MTDNINPLSLNVISRFSTEGTIQIKGELIEHDGGVSFDSQGNMYADEFVETEQEHFSFTLDGKIISHKFIEEG